MIFIDDRAGSQELIAPLRTLGISIESTRLDFGDVMFEGRGEKGKAVSIGVEFKHLEEFIGALRTQRLQGYQMKGMRDGLPTEPTNSLDPKYDKYLCQLMLYTYWLRLEFNCDVQGWLALALMYQSWNPQFRPFNIDFKDRELHDNYQMCMNFASDKGMI